MNEYAKEQSDRVNVKMGQRISTEEEKREGGMEGGGVAENI